MPSFLSPFSSKVFDSTFKIFPESNCNVSPPGTLLWPRLLFLLLSLHGLPGCLSVAAQLTLNEGPAR